jgi:hypothetical protein
MMHLAVENVAWHFPYILPQDQVSPHYRYRIPRKSKGLTLSKDRSLSRNDITAISGP